MKVDFLTIQEALIQEKITLDQFLEILIDNFGAKKTRKILRKNLEIALRDNVVEKEEMEFFTQVISSIR